MKVTDRVVVYIVALSIAFAVVYNVVQDQRALKLAKQNATLVQNLGNSAGQLFNERLARIEKLEAAAKDHKLKGFK